MKGSQFGDRSVRKERRPLKKQIQRGAPAQDILVNFFPLG